jgi:hypothetical protein
LISRSENFGSCGLSVSLLLNPTVGELVGNYSATSDLLAEMKAKGAVVYPAIAVSSFTTLLDLQHLHQLANGSPVTFVHFEMSSSSAVTGYLKSVPSFAHLFWDGVASSTYELSYPLPSKIKNSFQVKPRNSDYPARSFFTDMHLKYQSMGLSGFGDRTVTGPDFHDTGGPAYAIAIHITEQSESIIYCNHFVSTSNETQSNPAGKFGEAVAALSSYSISNPGKIDHTDACQSLLQLHHRAHFPGLGEVKRLSIQHHLELMSSVL